jgi:hypothetical protein
MLQAHLFVSMRAELAAVFNHALQPLICPMNDNNQNISAYSESTLTLVEAPVLVPGETAIDATQIQQMQAEIEEAAQMELPDEEDAF